jgi:two-component system OmpR family sensor kinase
MREEYIKAEHFSLIEYARYIKMSDSTRNYTNEFHHKFVDKHEEYIDISNFAKISNEFTKFIPMGSNKPYLQVFKSCDSFKNKTLYLKLKIIGMQIFLLMIFASLSFYLAKNALYPLKESIETLDKFAKDLIHDLNTPVTAMKLNIKILEKNKYIKDTKAIVRLNKSINTITELHENLTVLLEKKTFQVEMVNVCEVIKDVVELHQPSYKDISFNINCFAFSVETNTNALKEVLHNIISNACQYNQRDGYVDIYTKNKTLYIKNSGIEISEPDKIFNRTYSGQNSSGIGLDIVKRLCDAMDIKIAVSSDEKNSCFSLIFNKSKTSLTLS